MLATPFAFFRGAAAIMAADLAQTARTDLEAQLCGDAHLSNFGVFAAPDRRLVFDCNDFDETAAVRSSGTSSDWRPASRSPGWVATRGFDDERRCFYVRQLSRAAADGEIEAQRQ